VHCDVLVIGAGPGGSAAAYWLSRFGADVILVDRAHFPRNKPCGDGLGPGVEEMLLAMGLGDFLASSGCRYQGLRLFYPIENNGLEPEYNDLEFKAIAGWTIPRYILDDELRRSAESAGARFLGGYSAQRPIYRDGQLCGISGMRGGQQVSIHAPLTILATGANRTLLRQMGFLSNDSIPSLSIRTYLPHRGGLDASLQVYLDPDLFPGYAWIFPGPDDCANAGCIMSLERTTATLASYQLKASLGRLVQTHATNTEALSRGVYLDKPQGFPLRSDFPNVPVYKPGVMVVGEAAGLVDPITGEGIYTALRSGWLAARVANFALDAGDFSVEPLKVYSDILREWYGDYYEAARQFISWLSQPGREASLIRQTKDNPQVRSGLEEALLRRHPAVGLSILQDEIT